MHYYFLLFHALFLPSTFPISFSSFARQNQRISDGEGVAWLTFFITIFPSRAWFIIDLIGIRGGWSETFGDFWQKSDLALNWSRKRLSLLFVGSCLLVIQQQ